MLAKNQIWDISSVVDKIKSGVKSQSDDHYIPDIIEFCNSKHYLNLPGNGINLFPMQTIIFKSFYRGQLGNEKLKLTEEEIELLYEYKLDNVLEKYYSNEIFRELVLVLGRRAGKDFSTSIMALYETMKLLEIPGGSPFKYYNMAPGNPIYIVTVATSADQARILFNEIKSRLFSSNYFHNKVGHVESDDIFFLTPEDRQLQEKLLQDGLDTASMKVKGSIVIRSGHSNSEGLLGKRYACCAEGSIVLSDHGLAKIESLSGIKQENKIDITVHGLDGKASSDICFNNGIRNTLVFYTESGNKIEVTEDHQLLVWDKKYESSIFKTSKNIQIGDILVGQYNQNLWGNKIDIDFKWEYKFNKYGEKIKCPICNTLREQINSQHLKSHRMTCSEFSKLYPGYPTRSDAAILKFNCVSDCQVPNKVTASLARLLGYLVSEGNNTHSSTLSVTNTDEDIIRDMKCVFTDVFGRFSISSKDATDVWKKRWLIKICGKKILDFLNFVGLPPALAHEKEIPKIILQSPREFVIEFLRAYFDGEGHVSVREYRVFANSTSETLIRQIYLVFLNLGILSSVNFVKSNNVKHRDQWNITIQGAELFKFADNIGFISSRKLKDLEITKQALLKLKRKQNLFGLPVSRTINDINQTNKEKLLHLKKEYGFYGFSNQNTQSLLCIKKWVDIYNSNNVVVPESLKSIHDDCLFGDKVTNIIPSRAKVFDLHVKSKSHSYTCNGLINHNCLLFDEVASYKKSGGSTSGDRLYSALGPGTSDFTYCVGKDENGKDIFRTDSKIISISSPRSEEGILFQLYNDTRHTEGRLAFKLPTWKVNLKFSEEALRREHKYMTVNEFNMEFGAEFAGTAGEKFIPDHYIEEALDMGSRLGLDQKMIGRPGIVYYAHLDPATTSHNYALVLMHIEDRIRTQETPSGKQKTEKFKLFVVDHIKVWQPENGQSIRVSEVDEYVIDLYKKFQIGMVSYDDWNSQASIQKLRAKGIPTKLTHFRKQFKMRIYEHLHHLFVNHQIAIPRKGPHSQVMEMELKYLKRTYTPNGFKIAPNKEAPINTDDTCDCLAAVCCEAIDGIYDGYPRSTTVLMPENKESHKWSIGQGTYTDQQYKYYGRKFGW